jgi:hypothetical protein
LMMVRPEPTMPTPPLPPRRPPARRAATTRTVQKTRSRFPKWDPPQTICLPREAQRR